MKAALRDLHPEPAPKAASLQVLERSWYPLLCSDDLAAGKAKPIDVLGQALLVFRNRRGKPAVMRRHCCHMGGDLSRGVVTKNGIRCPIHAWEFGVGGERLHPDLPRSAAGCQPALPCTERHGIVFAFFGPRPLFELPTPAVPVFRSKVIVRDFDARYDVPTTFGFDRDHFATVHGRGLDSMELYSSSAYQLGTAIRAAVQGESWSDRLMRICGLDRVAVDIDFWAANLMLGHHKRSNTFTFLAALPLGDHRLRMFATMMQMRPDGGSLRRAVGWLRFKLSQPVVRAFMGQDERALGGVRFDPNCAAAGSPELKRWLAHRRELPTVALTELFNVD